MDSRLSPMAKTRRMSTKSQSDQDSDPNFIRITRSASKTPRASTAITPTTLKYVSLHDWWLVKAGSKGLAVGGFASREKLGVRTFCSAAIAKRHNHTTLETTDGITIKVSGFINRSRTHSNGFPLEVCNHFLVGFPYHWTEYATQSNDEDSANRGVPTRTNLVEFNMSSGSSANTYLPVSLDDLPVTRIRDLLMSPLGDSEKCALRKSIYDNVLSKFGGNAFRHSSDSVDLNMENRSPIKNLNSVHDERRSNLKKVKADQKYRGDDGILDAANTRADQFQKSCSQSKMDLNFVAPGRGVATRNITRLNNYRSKQEENLSSSYYVRPNISARTSTIKTTTNLSGGMVTGSALNKSHAKQDKEVVEISDKSAVRRSSSRQKKLKYLTLKEMG